MSTENPLPPAMEGDAKITEKVRRRIAKLTANNDHGEALCEAARALGLDDLVERLSSIRRRHLAIGHLSPELYHERSAIAVKLYAFARETLSKPVYRRLYGAM